MREQQELWMKQADRDRLKVLHEVEKGHLGEKEAGEQLKLSERWVRKLASRLRKEGDGGILHRLRGRASKRRITEAGREKGWKLVKREYGDFGPTLAAEYLAEKHGEDQQGNAAEVADGGGGMETAATAIRGDPYVAGAAGLPGGGGGGGLLA